jgi:hypothetical protein
VRAASEAQLFSMYLERVLRGQAEPGFERAVSHPRHPQHNSFGAAVRKVEQKVRGGCWPGLACGGGGGGTARAAL